MRRCRSKKWGPVSRTWTFCDLDNRHEGPHFHDGIEVYLVWPRRGERYVRVEGPLPGLGLYRVSLKSGRTESAEPWVLRLTIKAREGRLARHRAYQANRRRLRRLARTRKAA